MYILIYDIIICYNFRDLKGRRRGGDGPDWGDLKSSKYTCTPAN